MSTKMVDYTAHLLRECENTQRELQWWCPVLDWRGNKGSNYHETMVIGCLLPSDYIYDYSYMTIVIYILKSCWSILQSREQEMTVMVSISDIVNCLV